MTILIADDERPARSELLYILEELIPNATFVQAVNGATAIAAMSEQTFDLLVLDINLGDMEGTTVAAVATKLQPKVPIIFATAYESYALKAFEVGALDYILKPFDPKRIEKTIYRFLENTSSYETATIKVEKPSNLYKLAINVDKKIVLLDVVDVVYIETTGRGCTIHTIVNSYVDTTPIGVWEKKLQAGRFFRIHKSYLINIEYIHEVFPWYSGSFGLSMKGYEKEVLPIGRTQIKDLRQILGF